jgi:hypothetical protein
MFPRNWRLEGIRRQPKGLAEWPTIAPSILANCLSRSAALAGLSTGDHAKA